jgi:hypothetical protein
VPGALRAIREASMRDARRALSSSIELGDGLSVSFGGSDVGGLFGEDNLMVFVGVSLDLGVSVDLLEEGE